VVTSSFASIVNTKGHKKLYNEDIWNPVTIEEIHEDRATAYRASKTLAEKAAWEFVEKEKPNFTVTTLCPPLVLGPVVHYLNSLDALNTSNQRVRNMIQGKAKDELPASTPYIWTDVRDLAKAHVNAIEIPEAAGKRFFITEGYFSTKEIANIIRDNFPDLKDMLPSKDLPDDTPKDVYEIDNSRGKDVLKLTYRPLKECVVDLVKSLQEVGA
jgi:nucleoside-diphosphate-sugar epimerase